ncbi:hypothetical protein [Hungatella sp.]|nr:hypothetical protein [Hungatella sp.]
MKIKKDDRRKREVENGLKTWNASDARLKRHTVIESCTGMSNHDDFIGIN